MPVAETREGPGGSRIGGILTKYVGYASYTPTSYRGVGAARITHLKNGDIVIYYNHTREQNAPCFSTPIPDV